MASGRDAARDIVYGRRGGGWAQEPRRRKAGRGSLGADAMVYTGSGSGPPVGEWALSPEKLRIESHRKFTEDWTDDDWFCRARLAHALAAAQGEPGVPELSDVDRKAIRRYPTPPSMFDPLPSQNGRS